MTDRNLSAPHPMPAGPAAPATARPPVDDGITLEDLICLQSALEESISHLQGERDQLLADLATARQERANEARGREELQQQAQRLHAELAGIRTHAAGLERELDNLRDAHEHERATLRAELASLREQVTALERGRAAAEQELEQVRSAHAQELGAWHETAGQREAELAATCDGLARQLEEAQSHARRARDDAAALTARVQSTEAELLAAARRREEEWHASQRTVQEELDTVRRDFVHSQAATAAAQECVHSLEMQLGTCTAQLQEARGQADAALALAQQHAESLAAAEQRETALQRRCGDLERALSDVQKQSAVAQQRRDAMTAQFAELENERGALALRVDELTALMAQLERECERLRRDRASGEDFRKLRAENARLEARIIETDRQRGEAVQRHSGAVAGYMVELNQRSEALHAREIELQKVTDELALAKQTCEDAMGELAAQRQEQAALERQLAELRAAAPQASAPPKSEPNRPSAAAPRFTPPQEPARPAASKPAKLATPVDSITGPVTVIHLDDNKVYCDAAREVVSRLPGSRYLNTLEGQPSGGPSTRLLVVNLLNRAQDPLEAIASFIAADTYHQNVLAYCAEGANGFSFWTADFFAQPVDPDACVARLLESRGAIQRLLAATENFSVVSALREVLSRMRSSTSAALDLRQVIDLLPIVDPDVVLIDLSLPRGEGLRVVSRLRSDPHTRRLPLGILLPTGTTAAEFRQHALRAARDLPISANELADGLRQRLGVAAPAAALGKGRAAAG